MSDVDISAGLTEARFADVARIAVLRGGGIGDLVLALPAIESLRAAYAGAEIVLLGSPVHAAFLGGCRSPVDRVEVLPVARGIREASDHEDGAAALDDFRARIRRRGPIDLAVQLHGGGRFSNPFLHALGVRHTVGTATDDAVPLERTMPYVYYQHDTMRWLEVAALAGAAPVTLDPHLAPVQAALRRVERLLPDDGAPLAVLHLGASDPRRRWPLERFAAVAAGLLEDGAVVLVIGDEDDRALGLRLARLVGHDRSGRLASVAGELEPGETTALLSSTDVVVANDSGPRHLAQAVGAATVGVFWLGNVVNTAPFGRRRHRVHLSFTTTCPVCGVDVTQVGWTAPRCPHDVSFVADVPAGPVLADARQLMATSSPRRDTRGARAPRTREAG